MEVKKKHSPRVGVRVGRRITPESINVFFKSLEETCNVARSAAAAKVDYRVFNRKRKYDKQFAARWKRAVEVGLDSLEMEARRRGCDGVDKPVFYQGKKVATIKEYSDILLIFLLKSYRPEIFGERFRHEGQIRHDHQHQIGLDPVLEAKFNEIAQHRNGIRLLPAIPERVEGEGREDGEDEALSLN